MLKDVMDADKTFGILFQSSESSADLPPGGSVGCSVEVAVVQELPDGRSNILCVGITRFRILHYVDGESYNQAEIEFFDDDLSFDELTAEAEHAKTLFIRLLRASRRSKNEQENELEQIPELPDDPQAVSFIVSAYLDIENSEKQRFLELTDTSRRLTEVNRIIERLADDFERKALVLQISKKNGHGGKPPKME